MATHLQAPVPQSTLSTHQPLGMVRQFVTWAVDLVFPPCCVGCNRVDTLWCAQCQQRLDALPFLPPAAITGASALKQVAASGEHTAILQQLVVALKFSDQRQLAAVLGQRLYACLQQLNWTFDCITSVPLHYNRLRQRRYNQSQLIGAHIAAQTGVPMIPEAITRQLDTRPQVGLSAAERRQNVVGAFHADAALLRGKTILLIDDVYTTGATLNACASAALQAGATAVYGLTATRA